MSSTTTQPHLAHQFDDLAQQRLAATMGMWAFLATEILFFGGMFMGYAVYRTWYAPAWDAASRSLGLFLGTLNTVVLLTSSLTMALAVDSAKQGDSRRIQKNLLLTILLAVIFLGVKAYEYWEKWHHHHVPGPSFSWGHAGEAGPPGVELFFSFYFAMTGAHAVHMVIGIGILLTLWWQAKRGKFTAEWYTPVENTGLYWHFVDIVWVYLFPLLYLIDRT